MPMEHYIGDGSVLGPKELSILDMFNTEEDTDEAYRRQPIGRQVAPSAATDRYIVQLQGTPDEPPVGHEEYLSLFVAPELVENGEGMGVGRLRYPLDAEQEHLREISRQTPIWQFEYPENPEKSEYIEAQALFHPENTLNPGEAAVPGLPDWASTRAILDVAR